MATQTVENLMQGVSQQGAQNRRLTQCEEQFDCLNQPVEGCVARPGFEVVKKLFTGTASGVFSAPVFRDSDERYQVMIANGSIRVFNLLDGTEATVTVEDGADAYLACTGTPRTVFSLAAAEDVIFIANSERVPAMDATALSDDRPPEALFYFKAGSYLTTYVISVTIGGVVYQWQYQTPDNSVVANAQHITTDAICYSLYNAMVTDPVNSITDDLGFNIQRNGSVMRLWRSDGTDFSIDAQDGQGNTQLLGFKETVGGFDKLPASGFPGMVFRVIGDASEDADDFYVQFTGNSGTGVWEECAEPDIKVALDGDTMPVRLSNTGLNTFVLDVPPWGLRLVGDEESAPDPSFVGRTIREVAFDNARLLILTSASAVWSRNKNPYVFFPDTVQAKLATSPVDYEVKASKKIAILSTVLQTDAATFLWAEDRQFVVDTADLPFAGENISIPPSTSFTFNKDVAPAAIGEYVHFVRDNGPWSDVTALEFRQGSYNGSTGLTDHAPKYVPRGVTWSAETDAPAKAFYYSPEDPSNLYLYEWHFSERTRVQSAWQTWRLPDGCVPIWGTFDKSVFYLTVQKGGDVWLLKASLAPFQVDPEEGSKYLTRLDFRITEAAMTVTHDDVANETSFELPYLVNDTDQYRLITRLAFPDGMVSRGYRLPVERIEENAGVSVVVVKGNWEGAQVYGGWRISSERLESQFFPRDENGSYAHVKRCTLDRFYVAHSDSGFYRAEKLNAVNGAVEGFMTMTGRYNGDPENVFGEPVLKTGTVDLPIAALNENVRVRLVNDTFLPSAWQSAVWQFTPVT